MSRLSWNEIKSRSFEFVNEWKDECSEEAEAKSFWDGFFQVFGISRRRIASFEKHVKKLDGKPGFIDLLWKGTLLVEHKTRGRNLDRAHEQALGYFPNLKEHELPRYIVVSDFERFRLYDLETEEVYEFTLLDLPKNLHLFGFIAGYQANTIREEDPVNIEAAELMGGLHDSLLEIGYSDHKLELYLVRLLFCLFAEDTGIFERQIFQDFIENDTKEDGSDLAAQLSHLFQVLNTPEDARLTNLNETLAAFSYINGKLFEEVLPTASFDSKMRQNLISACELDWGKISPAIFGALFQSIMDQEARRNLGAHYTSESNILKVIRPLFLDSLYAEFKKCHKQKKKLIEFHEKLRSLTFLDPACGCGNFLIIAYRELRILELEILRAKDKLEKGETQMDLNVSERILLNVDQFYGIEIEEFPAQIAQVAMWLIDHQMNLLVSQEFGQYFARIPLSHSATIHHADSLMTDWEELIPAGKLSYIMGNPPFKGKHNQTEEQKWGMAHVFGEIPFRSLDFVSAWYMKAMPLLANNPQIDVAFVSSSSIVQGEQVSMLWQPLLDLGVQIHFAHRTFSWSNEASHKAAVHCVIIGFSLQNKKEKIIYDYADIKGEAHAIKAKQINPYLVDADSVIVKGLPRPIHSGSPMIFGSKPVDGGGLLMTRVERDELIRLEPNVEGWIKPFLGADEYINKRERFCLWLVDCPPQILRTFTEVRKRLEIVKTMREASKKAKTRESASTPHLFDEIRQSKSNYLLVPRVSSERRLYVPMGYINQNVICGDRNFQVPDATQFDFAMLTSTMHMAWMRAVCGRLESRYNYSNKIVYNTFPFPKDVSPKEVTKIEKLAQGILDARADHSEASLADLYDPLTMPPNLLKAHKALDKAVDAAYKCPKFKTESERVAYLFTLYADQLNENAV